MSMDEVLRQLWKCDLPEGRSGDWVVERFTVRRDPPPPDRLRGLSGGPDYGPPRRGTYTRLRHRQAVFMADTPDELASHREPILQAVRRGGHVLVHGLGLGRVVEAILGYPGSAVEHLTVVERSADVIRLVGEHLRARYADRLEIVRADAFTWQPPADRRYSVVWHDLWEEPQPDILPAMDRLEERYRGRCDWQACWAREYILAHPAFAEQLA